MKLFKKEPDMICWNCEKFISHKKVKWKPRKSLKISEMSLGDENRLKKLKEMEKTLEKIAPELNKERVASPNKVFGFTEYEYRGHCPECKSELTAFWFGLKSLSGNSVMTPKPFLCNNCKTTIFREFQFWYSTRFLVKNEVKEYLLTICPKCNAEQGYPFEYNLEYGIIK